MVSAWLKTNTTACASNWDLSRTIPSSSIDSILFRSSFLLTKLGLRRSSRQMKNIRTNRWIFSPGILEFITKSSIPVSSIFSWSQIFYTEVVKFIKILTFNVHEDDLACIIESRSLSLEYLSFKKLRTVYEQFLASFPTSLDQDLKILRSEERNNLTIR